MGVCNKRPTIIGNMVFGAVVCWGGGADEIREKEQSESAKRKCKTKEQSESVYYKYSLKNWRKFDSKWGKLRPAERKSKVLDNIAWLMWTFNFIPKKKCGEKNRGLM